MTELDLVQKGTDNGIIQELYNMHVIECCSGCIPKAACSIIGPTGFALNGCADLSKVLYTPQYFVIKLIINALLKA